MFSAHLALFGLGFVRVRVTVRLGFRIRLGLEIIYMGGIPRIAFLQPRNHYRDSDTTEIKTQMQLQQCNNEEEMESCFCDTYRQTHTA